MPAIVSAPEVVSRLTPPGSAAGAAQTGSGSGTVGVGATGQNSAVGAGPTMTNPAGSESVSAASNTVVWAGTVAA